MHNLHRSSMRCPSLIEELREVKFLAQGQTASKRQNGKFGLVCPVRKALQPSWIGAGCLACVLNPVSPHTSHGNFAHNMSHKHCARPAPRHRAGAGAAGEQTCYRKLTINVPSPLLSKVPNYWRWPPGFLLQGSPVWISLPTHPPFLSIVSEPNFLASALLFTSSSPLL